MTFDILFILIFIWAAIRGFTRGFIMQLTTLLALIIGIYFAIWFSGYISAIIQNKSGTEGGYLPIISFAITFLIIVIGVNLFGKLIGRLVEAIGLGTVNRLLGVLFGIIKYAILISAILTILNAFNSRLRFLPEDRIKESHLYRPLSALVPALFPRILNTAIPPMNLPIKSKQEKIV
jgi:membrane protein required for colicin V production